MTLFDVNAQCLVDDGEGQMFLCPRHMRDQAQAYFDEVYSNMMDDDYVTPALPDYLTMVDVSKLRFFAAVSE